MPKQPMTMALYQHIEEQATASPLPLAEGSAVSLRKNCTNCIFLGWADGDVNDPSGYICRIRDYQGSSEKENAHLKQMDDPKYRDRPKRCCSLPNVKGEPADE